MKALARSYVWWSGIDRDLEEVAKSCSACAAVKQSPVKAPLHPWAWPSRPWQRVHIDFAGPFLNKTFLIAVDAHSKWAEVVEMPQTTTARTISALRHMFATHGIPDQLVSDNGPQFTSTEFSEFTKSNGIKHTRSSPYHPATNGEAERFVRTFKEAMKTGRGDGLPLAHQLDNFLLSYRTTPHSTTGTPPCQLLVGRSLRTRWDLLRPDVGRTVQQHQSKQIEQNERRARLRSFDVGESVMVKNFSSPGPSWVQGTIAYKQGPLTYLVDVSDGRLWKRHVDHIKKYNFSRSTSNAEPEIDVDISTASPPDETEHNTTAERSEISDPNGSEQVEPTPATPSPRPDSNGRSPGTEVSRNDSGNTSDPSMGDRRYPTRQRRPPERFET